jgi:hypothetical protein
LSEAQIEALISSLQKGCELLKHEVGVLDHIPLVGHFPGFGAMRHAVEWVQRQIIDLVEAAPVMLVMWNRSDTWDQVHRACAQVTGDIDPDRSTLDLTWSGTGATAYQRANGLQHTATGAITTAAADISDVLRGMVTSGVAFYGELLIQLVDLVTELPPILVEAASVEGLPLAVAEGLGLTARVGIGTGLAIATFELDMLDARHKLASIRDDTLVAFPDQRWPAPAAAVSSAGNWSPPGGQGAGVPGNGPSTQQAHNPAPTSPGQASPGNPGTGHNPGAAPTPGSATPGNPAPGDPAASNDPGSATTAAPGGGAPAGGGGPVAPGPDAGGPGAPGHGSPPGAPGVTSPVTPSPVPVPAPGQVVTVHPGETLWSIAARHLGPGASDAQIARDWPRWWSANRDVVGPDPNLILPGETLRAPGPAPVADLSSARLA